MSISSVSFNNSLASMASGMASDDVSLQIAVAVMNQVQDQQKMAGQAIVNMINQASTIDGTGRIVNVAA